MPSPSSSQSPSVMSLSIFALLGFSFVGASASIRALSSFHVPSTVTVRVPVQFQLCPLISQANENATFTNATLYSALGQSLCSEFESYAMLVDMFEAGTEVSCSGSFLPLSSDDASPPDSFTGICLPDSGLYMSLSVATYADEPWAGMNTTAYDIAQTLKGSLTSFFSNQSVWNHSVPAVIFTAIGELTDVGSLVAADPSMFYAAGATSWSSMMLPVPPLTPPVESDTHEHTLLIAAAVASGLAVILMSCLALSRSDTFCRKKQSSRAPPPEAPKTVTNPVADPKHRESLQKLEFAKSGNAKGTPKVGDTVGLTSGCEKQVELTPIGR